MLGIKLEETFDPYFSAPIEVCNHFADFCETGSYKKNQIIKQSGQVERHGYFLPEGKTVGFCQAVLPGINFY